MRNNYKPFHEVGVLRPLLIIPLIILFSTFGLSAQEVSVTATVGTATANYSTFKAAIDNINNGTHQGVITVKMNTSTTETAVVSLVESGNVSGALYTSILIAPADTATVVKTISCSISGSALFTLNGADNVTIDGRPLSTGTSKLLTFSHLTNAANSHTVVLTGGATNNQFNYCTVQSASTGTIACSAVRITTGINSNNTFYYSDINGGNLGLEVNGTAGQLNDNITIKGCLFINQKATSIRLGNATAHAGVGNMLIDSNRITHSIATTTGGYQAINVSTIEAAATVTFTRNRVFDIQGSAANFLHGVFLSPVAASGTFIARNNSIIIGTATFPNSTSQMVRCFLFTNSFAATVIAENNTFRVGGTHVTSSANPTSMSVLKSNSNVGSSFTFKNNLCVNTRTGTTSQHIGYWSSQPTAGTNISDYNTVWGSTVFVGAWIGTFFGDEAGFRAAAFPNEQNSTIGNINFVNTTQPDVTNVNSAKLMIGTPLATVPEDIYGTVRSASIPHRGAHESTTLVFDTNEVQVVIGYTYGKIPVGTIDTMRAIIRNNGALPVNGLVVKLTGSLSGFIDSVIVNLDRFKDTTMYLAPYTPTVLGFDTLKVTVPDDQNNTNNLFTWVRENTLNSLNYTNGALGPFGNVGTNPEGEIVAKFSTPVPNYINQVNVNFTNPGFSGPWPFQVVIYPDSGGTFGPSKVPIYVSATQQTLNGIFNLSLPSIPVSGSFYLGVRQTTANNIGFAFQNENPIRNKTFYFRQGAGYQTLNWNDFAPNNLFRFMIEPRLKINDDLGVIGVAEPGSGCIAPNAAQTVSVTVQNLGLLGQDFSVNPMTVAGTITSPTNVVTQLGPVVVNTGLLDSDSLLAVVLTTNYNMSAAGNYTIRAWTISGVDNNKVNDTLPAFIRTVTNGVTAPYVQTFNAVTFPAEMTTNRFFISNANGVGGTNSTRVNLNGTNPFFANGFIVSPKITGVTANSILRYDYRITNTIGGGATVLGNFDSMNVFVSTDCGVSFTKVYGIVGGNHTSTTAFTGVSIPLGAYAGLDVVVRISLDWNGTLNDANVDIDNFRIVEGVNDMGVTRITNPCRAIIAGSAAFAPEVVVTNFGSAAQLNIPVEVSITGPVNYSGSAVISFATPGSVTAQLMSTNFNPSVAGTYTLKAWTALIGDGDPSNDTITMTFNVANLNLGIAAVNALTFGNVASTVSVANSATLNVSGAFTIEAWISRAGAGVRSILTKDSVLGFIQYSLALNDTNALTLSMNTSSGFYQVVSSVVVPVGYSHVAATFNGTEIRLYINGAVVAASAITASTVVQNNYDVYIGNNNDRLQGFLGSIDEVRVWNVARNADEIRSNMHTRLPDASNASLIAYYRLDEGTGNTFVTDASGNCNSGRFGATVPTWSIAQYPLGTPAVAMNTVNSDGSYAFTGTALSIAYAGLIGSDSVFVHRFNGAQNGTSPATNPGGVTAVYQAYWLAYQYGGATFTSSNLTFNLGAGALLSGVVNGDMRLFSRANTAAGAWTVSNATASNVSFASQTAEFSQTSAIFGRQLMVGANNNPLPVALLSFTGASSRADAVLRWSVASETNNKGFAIERSLDGRSFTEVGFVRGAGNSNRTNSYSYADRGVFVNNKMAYYRLKQVDLNGEYTYSNMVQVSVSGEIVPQVAVYPNPVSSVLNVEVDALSADAAKLTITDAAGKLIRSEDLVIRDGFNKYSVTGLETMSNGVFILRITTRDGRVLFSDKLVKAE